MLSDLVRDWRYACRSLLRARGLVCAVVVSLALGIGANVVIFSAVDAVLLRDVPLGDPDHLVDVFTSSGTNPYSNSSYPDYFDLRDSDAFESLAAYVPRSMTLDENGRTELLPGELVSGNYFDVLGVRIPAGRAFAATRTRSRARFAWPSSPTHCGGDRSMPKRRSSAGPSV